MTWTWRELIALALVRSGLVGRGQIATASQFSEGMSTADLLLDELDGKGLALPLINTEIQFNTIAGTAKYLLGPSDSIDPQIRPESIVSATCAITTNPTVNCELIYMEYRDYLLIQLPSTSGQPWNYAVNETWPRMELYLFPTPSQVYPITLGVKAPWAQTTRWPDAFPYSQIDVPSGFNTAFLDLLSLRLAQIYRLETPTLEAKANAASFMIAEYVYTQQRKATQHMPAGVFPWNIGIAGRNP